MQRGIHDHSPILGSDQSTRTFQRRVAEHRTRIGGREGWDPAPREPPILGAPAVLRLALIGGDRLMRGATANLLAAREGFEVLGTFASTVQFLASDLEEQPAVLLLDCDGDPHDCRPAVSVLNHVHTAAKIVMLCQEVSQETVRCAMEHRVGGVILKSYSTEDIGHAIRYVASGRTIMPAGWQRTLAPVRRDPLALSPRLREILTLIAQGFSNEEIAADLALSPNTIKFHVRTLYARLGVRNRVEASILYAQIERGGG
jgi:DNA-binding NarL/FixJ family response regulator